MVFVCLLNFVMPYLIHNESYGLVRRRTEGHSAIYVRSSTLVISCIFMLTGLGALLLLFVQKLVE